MTRRAHGEGSLYQLPSGRWRDTVELGWEGGKRRRKYVHGRSQREVREALDRIKRTRAEGLTPAPERLTVGRFLDEWLTLTVEPSLAPKTFRTYSGIVKGHIRPVLGHHRLSALAASDVQRMLNAKAAAGLSKRTVGMIREVLRNGLNAALRAGLLARNPAEHVRVPRPERRDVRPYTSEQLRRLLAVAESDRLGALYIAVVGLGLRQSEALALRWEDVDLEKGVVTVSGALTRSGRTLLRKEPKTAAGRRRLPVPDFVLSSLQRHRVRQLEARILAGSRWVEGGCIFTTTIGTPLDGPTVTRRLHALLRAADLPDLRFHDLRHQFASWLLAGGENVRLVAELLGHQDSSLTLRTYSHVLPQAKVDAMSRLDRVLSGS
jgi:integrase